MTLPTITTIIPTKNHADWVTDAIDSVVDQDYPNSRIVVIDDGSTDNTWEILSKVALNVHPINNTSEPADLRSGQYRDVPIIIAKFSQSYGPSCARNYGIKTSWEGTDLFAFLDSDDWFTKDKFQKTVPYFINQSLIGLVYSDFTTINAINGYKQRQYKEPFSKYRLLQECLPNMDSIFSKQVFEKVGLFEESLRTCEDYDMYLRISEKFLICHIPESLVNIRIGSHSSTDTVSVEDRQSNYQKVFERLKSRQKTV